jgi:hypothetical protein
MKINVPISYGELLDKLTILEIKKLKITDNKKLLSVNNEYLELMKIYTKLKEDYKDLDIYYRKLIEVNTKLWEIEDGIRLHEKSGNFGDSFIDLARSVYITNDLRFEIKSKINKKYNSAISEEKSYKKYK